MKKLTNSILAKLIQAHGRVTHYTVVEGGMWLEVRPMEGINLKLIHSLQFEDHVEWDRINGIRTSSL